MKVSTTRRNPSFSSNVQRLSLVEWGFACAVLLAVTWTLPSVGSVLEAFDPKEDYRLPYVLSEDYWMFRQCARKASQRLPAVIIGDSFVWGQYVGMRETIAHELNRLAGEEFLFNLGVNGLHPAAMKGMIRYYGSDIREMGVILHLNFLWMSSAERDLQGEEEFLFNHPRLVPQFIPQLDCYRPGFAQKVSVLVERNWGFLSWARHVKQLYFENLDIPNWTILYPYTNPFNTVTFRLPPVDEGPRSRPVPWTRQKIEVESFPWIPLESSYQWSEFQKVIERLRRLENQVFVLIGPLNPYLQTEESQIRYRELLQEAEEWLARNKVRFYSPTALPSKLYADASHPLRDGYTKIADEVFQDKSFNHWLSEVLKRLT